MSVDLGDSILRLLAAAGLSGLIGFEREVAQKAAGMRTHMMVGLGAGLFTLLGVTAFGVADPARVAAQVVAGVGFLGAGAIFRMGFTVRGLTTAAGLWTAAAVGMAAGLGHYAVALVATIVAVGVLYLVGVLQWLLRGRHELATAVLTVRISDPSKVLEVRDAIRPLVAPEGSAFVQEIGAGKAVVRAMVEPGQAGRVMLSIYEVPGVERVSRIDS